MNSFLKSFILFLCLVCFSLLSIFFPTQDIDVYRITNILNICDTVVKTTHDGLAWVFQDQKTTTKGIICVRVVMTTGEKTSPLFNIFHPTCKNCIFCWLTVLHHTLWPIAVQKWVCLQVTLNALCTQYICDFNWYALNDKVELILFSLLFLLLLTEVFIPHGTRNTRTKFRFDNRCCWSPCIRHQTVRHVHLSPH